MCLHPYIASTILANIHTPLLSSPSVYVTPWGLPSRKACLCPVWALPATGTGSLAFPRHNHRRIWR